MLCCAGTGASRGMMLRCSAAAAGASAAAAAAARRHYTAPVKDMRFLRTEVFGFDTHYRSLKHLHGDQAAPDMVEMVIDENAKFAENVLAPLNHAADAKGCEYVDEHTVKTPKGFKEAYAQWNEGGWFGMTLPEKYGGQGLPPSLYVFVGEVLATANFTWTMFPGLSLGAFNTIALHGTEELKGKYLPKLVSGEWTGTMCLTEPQCGSDLAQVSTKAQPLGDGSYAITGTKIFISCGEHDMADNILHCVLARLPDAPAGIRGISLFLVPKVRVHDDGSLATGYNGCNIGRIEEKMGCHGSPTCEINFEQAQGFLIGEANKGMRQMFTFINTSRIGTAMMGVALAELSWQNALQYALGRRAMRSLSGAKEPHEPADAIVAHPSVRRMLLTQKAVCEGGRAMLYECAMLHDLMLEARDGGRREEEAAIDDRMGFLTPILKGFLTEVGTEVANIGVQVYGGHGYVRSNQQEQILRDVRISTVWEGTTQIQALDLLGRKVLLQKLKPIRRHCASVARFAWGVLMSSAGSRVKWHASVLLYKTLEWLVLSYRIAWRARRDTEFVGAASVEYLMYSGYVSLAHHWLKMEVTAETALTTGGIMEKDFYLAKVETAHFFFENLLPRTQGLIPVMMAPLDSLMSLPAEHFSFDTEAPSR